MSLLSCHGSPKPTQSGNLTHHFILVSVGIFEELSFGSPFHDDLDVYVPFAALEVNGGIDKKQKNTYKMPRGRASFTSSFLTFATLSVDRYGLVQSL